MIRLVIDTNVLISALLFKNSVPFQSVKLAENRAIILYSQATLDELEQVLYRKKFNKYLSSEERQIFLSKFIISSEFVSITETITICRDQKDNKFLELAVSGNANVIITGDLDLLILNPFQNIEIMSPDAFINQFKQ
ncbi:Nucleotide binding protein PINc [Gloeothece citriformis PCC 7424]|uniref:Nucleotide binding protein PINc n=1 Tax=Gloeothece citriformis (strain PCC 7424) TaxID=65393 RepID=B7K8R5_GLOC7|nr:putative toxin-antitoxin system toxin component, PIN family [Gloeothece citriformis]ACK71263.1 Nucleotide binding protein PINc [Gloeothece citriformis PCC 7424]